MLDWLREWVGGGGGVVRSVFTSARRLDPLFGGDCIFMVGPWLMAGGVDRLDCCNDVGLPRCCICCCKGSGC